MVVERKASPEVLQMMAVKVKPAWLKPAWVMAVLKRLLEAELCPRRAEELVQLSQKAAVPLMAAQPHLLEAARPTRVWGLEMTAEMVMAARVMSERTAAGRVVTDRVEERAEKLASLLEGIG